MKLYLEITATQNDPTVTVTVLVDGTVHGTLTAHTEPEIVNIELDDAPADHSVDLVMQGKTQHHTVINDQGEIVSDLAFSITALKIQNIDVQPIFCQGLECYTHSFNDPQREPIEDEFYGYIGCNGTVSVKFFTPIYLWLARYF